MSGLPPYQFLPPGMPPGLPPGHPAWQAMMAQQQAQQQAQLAAQVCEEVYPRGFYFLVKSSLSISSKIKFFPVC